LLSQTDQTPLTSQSANQSGSKRSIVYLVGAGSGDPGLITVRGAELLAAADVVVYDALANPELIRLHAPNVETIYVGKRAAAHSMTQDQINATLVQQARHGKCVVRLKGGDPFVFGRGGEECEALAAAGVAFEVVPGITAAIAAPTYAGIPVTHRDFNSSFTFITGHEKEEAYRDEEAKTREPGVGSDIDWPTIAKLPCIAFYMGVKSLPRICARLIEHGMPADTPAATIQSGTTPRQRTVVGSVSDLPQRVAEAKIAPPAMTIIGRVVSLRETMNWFERRPLFGQTIVVTRTRDQASELSSRLVSLGANVIEAPTIELTPPRDQAVVDAALRRAGEFDWIIFTSQTGVRYAKRRLFELGLDSRAFGKARIAVIGESTGELVHSDLSLRVDLCPQRSVAEALADELEQRGEIKSRRFLLLRADIARYMLIEQLEHGGAGAVEDIAIYETKSVDALPDELRAALAANQVSWVTFTSSSTVRNFTALLGDNYRSILANVKLASIGPITSTTLNELGLMPAAQAQQFDLDGLVEAMINRRADSD
jgi:uroporphyrinogen III methyltransferase/synthase